MHGYLGQFELDLRRRRLRHGLGVQRLSLVLNLRCQTDDIWRGILCGGEVQVFARGLDIVLWVFLDMRIDLVLFLLANWNCKNRNRLETLKREKESDHLPLLDPDCLLLVAAPAKLLTKALESWEFYLETFRNYTFWRSGVRGEVSGS